MLTMMMMMMMMIIIIIIIMQSIGRLHVERTSVGLYYVFENSVLVIQTSLKLCYNA